MKSYKRKSKTSNKHLQRFFTSRPVRPLIIRLLGYLSLLVCFSVKSLAQTNSTDSYRIYLDADQTNSSSSGQSIELGIRAAMSEVDWKIGGRDVELIIKDHRGNTSRSQFHLEQFNEDQNGLAVFGGLHSPPLLSARKFINDKKILTLVPWAAATPITRSSSSENWIFRLSLDDSKAGKVIIKDTIATSHFKKPFLLFEDSGWGQANKQTMTNALEQFGHKPAGINFFQWGIGQHEARAMLEGAITKGADSFVLVANAPEGITFAKAMLSLEENKRKPIRSHWGITGGRFFQSVGASSVQKLDLRFIQTSFSFFESPLSNIASQALSSASRVIGGVDLTPDDIKAPAGFIHAYDLTRLFIAAASNSSLSGDAKADAIQIKEQLEKQTKPVEGLIKTYKKAFSKYHKSNFDAHEALNEDDFVMASYDQAGNIRLLK